MYKNTIDWKTMYEILKEDYTALEQKNAKLIESWSKDLDTAKEALLTIAQDRDELLEKVKELQAENAALRKRLEGDRS